MYITCHVLLSDDQVKTALHLVFVEAMTDLDNKTPNAQLLHGNTVLPSDILDITSNLQCFGISPSPFIMFVHIEMKYDPTHHSAFGIELNTCGHLHHAYISAFLQPAINCTLHHAQWTSLGSYVISISDTPIFSKNDIDTAHQLICAPNLTQPTTITIVLAPEHHSTFDDCHSSTQLHLHDLCHILALHLVTGRE